MYEDGEGKENTTNSASKEAGDADEGGPSNEDLLYDPDLDDEDEKWVETERQRHRPKKSMLVTLGPSYIEMKRYRSKWVRSFECDYCHVKMETDQNMFLFTGE